MLVINGVELALLDELKQMGELHRDNAVILQRAFQSLYEIVDLRNMGKDIVADDQIGLYALPDQSLLCKIGAEEIDDGVDSFLDGDRGGVGSGVDPQNRYIPFLEILQQVAVIGSDLDDLSVFIVPEALDHHIHIGFRMRQPACRI